MALLATLPGCAATVQGSPRFIGTGGAIADYSMPVASVEDRRFAGIIRQRYDFSCGSAALATLMRFHYGFAVGEEAAFRGMWARGDQGQIRRLGFSLLDMKRWLASHRLNANGYQVSLDQIEKTGIPGIVLISVKNYRHFVVLKGVRGDEVLLGDSSSGLTVMSRAEFMSAWNKVYFVIDQDQQLARGSFNRTAQWATFARAPLGDRYGDPVSQQALALAAPYYGDF